MSTKIIQTITLKIGGKEVIVSKEDAKKLYAELHELFGEKVVTLPPVYVERHRERPSWFGPDIICRAEAKTDPRSPRDVPMLGCRQYNQ
jgi:hypothetical protein